MEHEVGKVVRISAVTVYHNRKCLSMSQNIEIKSSDHD